MLSVLYLTLSKSQGKYHFFFSDTNVSLRLDFLKQKIPLEEIQVLLEQFEKSRAAFESYDDDSKQVSTFVIR